MKERLQKIIAQAGFASRRAAEELIVKGRVAVNGAIASLGDKADPSLDDIEVDGKPLKKEANLVYIMLYKPRGYVTTMHDEKGRKCIPDLYDGSLGRLYPVGRLDMDSEGLLILTNDGGAAYRLSHPSGEIYKEYEVLVEGTGIQKAVEKLRGDMTVDGVTVRAKNLRIISQDGDRALISIVIGEGRNRQVRKMCLLSGLSVLRLKRVAEGRLQLSGLRPGEWRELTDREKAYLRSLRGV